MHQKLFQLCKNPSSKNPVLKYVYHLKLIFTSNGSKNLVWQSVKSEL